DGDQSGHPGARPDGRRSDQTAQLHRQEPGRRGGSPPRGGPQHQTADRDRLLSRNSPSPRTAGAGAAYEDQCPYAQRTASNGGQQEKMTLRREKDGQTENDDAARQTSLAQKRGTRSGPQ